MITKEIKVTVLGGRDDRPIANLVQIANDFNSRIYLESDGRSVNAKSIMGMMTLGLYPDEPVTVTAEGDDEADAVSRIEAYLTGGN
ncbi:MAG: HPr family phosphocarrier protein [Lachnospiraceae bacterium]|nr:HPr family phosphocarrier protein [Lachnospiraceae bacterium]